MTNMPDPKEAFPYKAPSMKVRQKYSHIFELDKPLETRFFKSLFDKVMAITMLFVASPILLLLKIAYVIEGIIIPENKGPMFFYFNAVSGGEDYSQV